MNLYKNNRIISNNVKKADNFIKRLLGLLLKSSLGEDEGLLFEECNSIHSIGMRFHFDAVYLDKDNKVVCLKQNIKPNRILPIVFKAKKVLEFRAGFIKDKEIVIGDSLSF